MATDANINGEVMMLAFWAGSAFGLVVEPSNLDNP